MDADPRGFLGAFGALGATGALGAAGKRAAPTCPPKRKARRRKPQWGEGGYDDWVAKKDSARLQSEREVSCPCCHAVLVVDLNLGRVISHSEPSSGLTIELSDAQRILADEKARRDAAFEQSFNTERTKGDALSKRFEEALKQAKEEPISKPTRDFDLD